MKIAKRRSNHPIELFTSIERLEYSGDFSNLYLNHRNNEIFFILFLQERFVKKLLWNFSSSMAVDRMWSEE